MSIDRRLETYRQVEDKYCKLIQMPEETQEGQSSVPIPESSEIPGSIFNRKFSRRQVLAGGGIAVGSVAGLGLLDRLPFMKALFDKFGGKVKEAQAASELATEYRKITVSKDTPLAQAMLNKAVGSTIEYQVKEKKYKVFIVDIYP